MNPTPNTMLKQLILSTSAAITLAAAGAAAPCRTDTVVQTQVDWPAFIARHDMVWDGLPENFDYGAFLGNGMLGATIYQEGDNRLRFEMGRADVTEHRRDNSRLPIGGLVLTTAGKIKSATMRLDLWNAEVRGTVLTDNGALDFRAFIHTEKMVLIIDVKAVDGETAAAFAWNAAKCTDRGREVTYKDPPHPAARNATEGEVSVCIQGRSSGGEFATAYAESNIPGIRRLYLSIADTFPGNTASAESVAQVRQSMAADFDSLLKSHREWWNAFYPRNFVSIPDARLESFYWIQWYKLACASRPDSVPVDLLGPWFRKTGWPRIWWNLNIETLYLPVYTGNRLELGESFVNFIDKKRDNFFRNGKEIWKFDDCATVPHTTNYEGLRGDGDCAPDAFINPGDFTWALHNYYLHYRYTMDHSMITDQKKHAFYPLLKGSVNLYLRILKKGEDGKLHLPVLMSPEYGNAADNNYNLGLLRWGCQTLMDLNHRYQLNDPMVPTWEQTMKDLVAYPVDENGLCVGAGMPFKKSHRHWSHVLMVHPLHIMTADHPADRELLNKSVLHWLTTDGATGINGWSRAAAASLYATLGDGINALKQIHGHLADKRFVRPNTMYIEVDPVIECSIVLNRSLQDMLLQSWGNKINIFPAVPATWKEAVFHDLRAEGAFLVSANRKDGNTEWVRVKSLAGEPCRVQAVFASTPKLRINGDTAQLQPAANGIYDLPLKKDDEALLFVGKQANPLVKPVPMAEEDANPWGGDKHPAPALSTGNIAPPTPRAFSRTGETGNSAPSALDLANIRISKSRSQANNGLIQGNGDLVSTLYSESNKLILDLTKNDVYDARIETAADPGLLRIDVANHSWSRRPGLPASWNNAFPGPVRCARVSIDFPESMTASLDLRRAVASVNNSDVTVRSLAQSNVYEIHTSRHVTVAPVTGVGLPTPVTGLTGEVSWITQVLPADTTGDWPGMNFAVASAHANARYSIAVVSSLDSANPLPDAIALVRAAQLATEQSMIATHESAWQDFWSKSSIRIADQELSDMWYQNLYFSRCVSKPGAQAVGLFAGPMLGSGGWHDNYTINYNFEQTFWGNLITNHVDLVEPYIRVFERYLPRARWFANETYGLGGACFPHNLYRHEPVDPTTCVAKNHRMFAGGPWAYTIGNSGYALHNIWLSYKYQPDPVHLAQHVYPILRDVGRFYINFVDRCSLDGNGKAILGPSVSPEHGDLGINNCPFDIAFIQFTLKALIEGATKLGTDAGLVTDARRVLGLLPPHPTSGSMVVDRQGGTPIEYNIPVPITPVFPCEQVTWFSPAAEKSLFINTLNNISTNGNNSMMMLALAKARLSTPDAMTWLKNAALARMKPNRCLNLNTTGSFNSFGSYTEQFAISGAISELLLQSVGDIIRILPAWPAKLDAGFTNLRAQGGFLVSATSTKGVLTALSITSTAGGTLKLLAPWNTVYVNGQQAAIDGTGIVTVNTTTGQSLTFSPTAR
jgi:hypothetical protein